MTTASPTYTFTQEEAQAAYDEWGCNCGPSALAFALQLTLDDVRPVLLGFNERRYMSPTAMQVALELLGRDVVKIKNPSSGRDYQRGIDCMFAGPMSLVRIQWTGPWTADGKTTKWAARQTHWIACWKERGVPLTFDCNGGMRGLDSWEQEVVPAIVATIPRADGGWYPANVWRLKDKPSRE